MIAQILVVDDDIKICRLIAKLLRRDGFDVITLYSAEQANQGAKYLLVDLIISDIMMPGISGRDFVRGLRDGRTLYATDIPVIFISALDELKDRIGSIQDGGDDYLVKPFETEELLVRVKSLLRRHPPKRKIYQNSIIDQSGVCLLIVENEIMIGEKRIELSLNETTFLRMIIGNKGVPISKNDIMREIYPELLQNPETRVLEVMIGRLRKKLVEDGVDGIKNKRGEGYYWER